MRLADMIREDKTAYFDEFRRALAQATPFEISPEVGRIAGQIGRSSAAKVAEIMPFCRVPFKSAWFEWRGVSADFLPAGPKYDLQKPDRFGVLFVSDGDDHSRATAVFAWGTRGIGVNVCPFAAMMDWSESPHIPDFARITSADDSLKHYRQTGTFKNDSDEDIKAIINRGTLIANPMMLQFWKDMILASGGRKLPITLTQTWADDINGEPGFAEALLAVINSRNLVSITPDTTDLTKLNRARAKRGKPPMLQFRKVAISLSRSATTRASQRGDGAMPLHTVRGHFKVRKSGIYWWAPYWRGDASVGVVSRTGYTVKP